MGSLGRRLRLLEIAASVPLLALPLALLLACDAGEPTAPTPRPSEPARAQRIVSLNPSLTAILVSLGAADLLVGIDSFSATRQPMLAELPRVGGLFNPSLEAVAALEPDAVVLVPSVEQRDFVARIEALGVPVIVFDNIELDQVLANITRLGALVGHDAQAAQRVSEIRASRARAIALTRGRPRPTTVLVLQRDPLFIVGRGGFIDELLHTAGAENLGAHFDGAYPQVAVEWLVNAAPEVLIDMTDEPGDPFAFWSRWPTIPAVASRRVLHLDPNVVTLPGPYLDRSIEALVSALHGAALANGIARARASGDVLAEGVAP